MNMNNTVKQTKIAAKREDIRRKEYITENKKNENSRRVRKNTHQKPAQLDT